MPAGINQTDTGFATVRNGTGATIPMGSRLTLTKLALATPGAEFAATVAGNGVTFDAVATEPIGDGDVGPAKLRNAPGFHIVLAGGVFAEGAALTADVTGKVATGGGTAEGKAIDAATAANDLVRMRAIL